MAQRPRPPHGPTAPKAKKARTQKIPFENTATEESPGVWRWHSYGYAWRWDANRRGMTSLVVLAEEVDDEGRNTRLVDMVYCNTPKEAALFAEGWAAGRADGTHYRLPASPGN